VSVTLSARTLFFLFRKGEPLFLNVSVTVFNLVFSLGLDLLTRAFFGFDLLTGLDLDFGLGLDFTVPQKHV
jgi:hypothetical protein